ncbi:hypothetical protein [Escherichia coli]|nr:hypothetical protein [Escherichia coli]
MSVGAFLRQWLMPDAIITSGGMGEVTGSFKPSGLFPPALQK